MGLPGKMATRGNHSPTCILLVKLFTGTTCAVKTCFIGISGDDKSINKELFGGYEQQY